MIIRGSDRDDEGESDLVDAAGVAGDLIYRVARGQDRFDIYLGAGQAARRMQAVFGQGGSASASISSP